MKNLRLYKLAYDVLNMTNEEVVANEGYPLPGRGHRVSLKMSF